MKRIAPLAFAALIAGPLAHAGDINVTYGAEFQEELEDNYGMKEGEYLAREIKEDIQRELDKRGIDVASVTVEILDAKPNKPTMQQMSNEPSLDYGRSKSIGGMKMKAAAFDADGNLLGEMDYKWFENDIRFAGLTTWADANTASRRFAKKFVESLAD